MPKRAEHLDALFAVAHAEASRRRRGLSWGDKAQHLRAILMGIQMRLEADQSRRIAVRSPRQTGKSTGVLLICLIRCLERAGSEWVVICLTRQSAKSIYWGPLKALNETYELGLHYNNQELTASLKNGSTIRFVGADNISEIEKLRGGRYDGVVVDEGKSYPPILFEELVHAVIEPALMAKNGQLFLIGTPGDHLEGPFYLATSEEPVQFKGADGMERFWNWPYGSIAPKPFVWSLHQWTMRDNTTQFRRADGTTYTMWDQALEIKDTKGYADDNPTWRREFLGHWVANDARRVWRYHSYVHDYEPMVDTLWGIPEGVYELVLGVDLGTRDGTGMVLWASGVHTPDLWEVYSGRKRRDPGQRLPTREIAEWYRELEAEYGTFVGGVADPGGLATMVLDTLADEYQVYLEPAERKEKEDHVELFNNDLDAKRIHIRKGSALSEELREGRWDLKKLAQGKRVEDPGIPNDVADAGLYGFRYSNHRRAKAKAPPGPGLFTHAWFAEREDAEFRAAQEAARRRLSPAELDQPFWEDR